MKFPTFKELYTAFVNDLSATRPGTNPYIRNSWVKGFAKGAAGSQSLIVASMKDVVRQLSPLTATGIFLRMWGRVNGMYPLVATAGVGRLQVFSATDIQIAIGDIFTADDNGKVYTVTVPGQVGIRSFETNPTSIQEIRSSSNQVAKATVTYDHGFLVGDSILVSGSSVEAYNGIFIVSEVPTPTSFSYDIPDTVSAVSATPYMSAKRNVPVIAMVQDPDNNTLIRVTILDTGVLVDKQYVVFDGINELGSTPYEITVEDQTHFTFSGTIPAPIDFGHVLSYYASVVVICTSTGSDSDVRAGGTFSSPNVNILNSLTLYGIQGGAEDEAQEDFRDRILLKRSQQEGIFTNTDITLAAKSINGNDKVIIQNPTAFDDPSNDVRAGYVNVYILRTRSAFSVIPIGTVLEQTKRAIITKGALPGNTPEYALRVLAPRLKPIDISISVITPDTAGLRQAVRNQYIAYFEDYAKMGNPVDNDVLRAQLLQVVDLTAADVSSAYIDTFTWGSPNVQTELDDIEVPTLGTLFIGGVEVV